MKSWEPKPGVEVYDKLEVDIYIQYLNDKHTNLAKRTTSLERENRDFRERLVEVDKLLKYIRKQDLGDGDFIVDEIGRYYASFSDDEAPES